MSGTVVLSLTLVEETLGEDKRKSGDEVSVWVEVGVHPWWFRVPLNI